MIKTASGLVEYCKAQLGLPYWYGTFGHVGTESLYLYNKSRLPNYYTAADFESQFGKRVHDCVGLIKGYIWSKTPTSEPVYVSNGCPDHSANSMLKACTEQGKIATLPEVSGTLLFMPDHVGVYIGNGEAIEARGHKYGVVQTKVKGRGWKNWGKCPYINYESEDDEMTVEAIEKMSDEQVDALMARLNLRLAKLPASDYAEDACKKAVKSDLFKDGDKDGTLDNPRGFMLRQDIAVILDRDGRLN